jgi:hypothetical protein
MNPFFEQITKDTRFFTKSSNVPVERNTMNTQHFDKFEPTKQLNETISNHHLYPKITIDIRESSQ